MHKVKVATVLALFTALNGCGDISRPVAIGKGKDMVASLLKDPGSVSFENVVYIEEELVGETYYGRLCGLVNAKNSFGGFTGMQRFSADMHYSLGGSFNVSDLQIEEGLLGKTNNEDITYFEANYWKGRCEPKQPYKQ